MRGAWASRIVRSWGLLVALLVVALLAPAAAFADYIEGIVQSAGGGPADGVTVIAKNTPYSGLTDANGFFRISQLPAGNYHLQYMDYNRGRFLPFDTYGVSSTERHADAVLALAGHIAGTVSDASGPSGSLTMYTSTVSGGGSQGVWLTPNTDAGGNYDVGGLDAGSYIIHVQRDWIAYYRSPTEVAYSRNQATPIQVSPPNTAAGINLPLATPATVTGRVTDVSTGLPVTTAAVNAFVFEGAAWVQVSGAGGMTDSNGNYTAKVPANKSPIRLQCMDYTGQYLTTAYGGPAVGSGSDIAVTANQTTANIDIQMNERIPMTLNDPGTGIGAGFGGWSGSPTLNVTDVTNQTGAPANFQLSSGAIYDISTSPAYPGSEVITITVPYNPNDVVGNEADLKLMHYAYGDWSDITIRVDTINHVVMGATMSLSPFGVFSPLYIAPEEPLPPEEEVNVPASSTWSIVLLALAGFAGVVVLGTKARRST